MDLIHCGWCSEVISSAAIRAANPLLVASTDALIASMPNNNCTLDAQGALLDGHNFS